MRRHWILEKLKDLLDEVHLAGMEAESDLNETDCKEYREKLTKVRDILSKAKGEIAFLLG